MRNPIRKLFGGCVMALAPTRRSSFTGRHRAHRRGPGPTAVRQARRANTLPCSGRLCGCKLVLRQRAVWRSRRLSLDLKSIARRESEMMPSAGAGRQRSPGKEMTLREVGEKYRAVAGGFGRPAAVFRFGRAPAETAQLFGGSD